MKQEVTALIAVYFTLTFRCSLQTWSTSIVYALRKRRNNKHHLVVLVSDTTNIFNSPIIMMDLHTKLHKRIIFFIIALLFSSSLNHAFSLHKTAINSKRDGEYFLASLKSPLASHQSAYHVVAKRTSSTTERRVFLQPNNEKSTTATRTDTTSIRERISKISNVASMLCVIDCTVLPVVTVLLPLIGLGASSAQAEWLHEFGHSVAIFFVLPSKLLFSHSSSTMIKMTGW